MKLGTETKNALFPGHKNKRDEFDYQGPISGWFSLLHHADNLVEWSDNVMARVQYIATKPAREQAVRLRHIVFLGDRGIDYEARRDTLDADYKARRDTLDADYKARRAPLDADYKARRAPLYADYKARRDPLYADYKAKCAPLYADYKARRAPLDAEILTYIKPLIGGFAWNGSELVFGHNL